MCSSKLLQLSMLLALSSLNAVLFEIWTSEYPVIRIQLICLQRGEVYIPVRAKQ